MKTNSASQNSASGDADPDDAAGHRYPATLGRVEIIETDNLDETVLGAAAVGIFEMDPPEISRETANLTGWDEPVGATGSRAPGPASEDETVDAERLIDAGMEEADRERREAARMNEDD